MHLISDVQLGLKRSQHQVRQVFIERCIRVRDGTNHSHRHGVVKLISGGKSLVHCSDVEVTNG